MITESPCRISAYRTWPSVSGSTTPRVKANARSRNSIDALTFATARYVFTACIPGARPLAAAAVLDSVVCEDAAALRESLGFVPRRRDARAGTVRFRGGMAEI